MNKYHLERSRYMTLVCNLDRYYLVLSDLSKNLALLGFFHKPSGIHLVYILFLSSFWLQTYELIFK